jgi:hypothetical protein
MSAVRGTFPEEQIGLLEGLLISAKPTQGDHIGIDDPNVWSGRAVQEVFVDPGGCGLASMYPASDWSVLCSEPSWISARLRSD